MSISPTSYTKPSNISFIWCLYVPFWIETYKRVFLWYKNVALGFQPKRTWEVASRQPWHSETKLHRHSKSENNSNFANVAKTLIFLETHNSALFQNNFPIWLDCVSKNQPTTHSNPSECQKQLYLCSFYLKSWQNNLIWPKTNERTSDPKRDI